MRGDGSCDTPRLRYKEPTTGDLMRLSVSVRRSTCARTAIGCRTAPHAYLYLYVY